MGKKHGIPCDFSCRARFSGLLPFWILPFRLLQLTIGLQLRYSLGASCHPPHCEPRLFNLSAHSDRHSPEYL